MKKSTSVIVIIAVIITAALLILWKLGIINGNTKSKYSPEPSVSGSNENGLKLTNGGPFVQKEPVLFEFHNDGDAPGDSDDDSVPVITADSADYDMVVRRRLPGTVPINPYKQKL